MTAQAIEIARKEAMEKGLPLEFNRNETVMSAPSALPMVWLIKQGAAALTLSKATGKDMFWLLGPGDIFCSRSFAAFEGVKVRAKTKCLVHTLQGGDTAELSAKVAEYWSQRLIHELERDARLTPSERIEQVLAEWARKAGTRLGGGVLLEGVHVAEVAARARVSRMTVYSVIKALESEQKLTRSGSAFLVKDAMLAEDGLAA